MVFCRKFQSLKDRPAVDFRISIMSTRLTPFIFWTKEMQFHGVKVGSNTMGLAFKEGTYFMTSRAGDSLLLYIEKYKESDHWIRPVIPSFLGKRADPFLTFATSISICAQRPDSHIYRFL